MKKILFVFLICVFIISCSNKYKSLKTVEKVDINNYLGTWYEIARLPHRFEKNCKNVSANYTLKENGDIKVINSCTKIDTNKKSSATGIAYSTNKSNNKLKVSFFRPFYGDYWILILDKNYEYAVVGSPSREYLWILSRTKKIKKELYNKLLFQINKLDFDTKNLIKTIQE